MGCLGATSIGFGNCSVSAGAVNLHIVRTGWEASTEQGGVIRYGTTNACAQHGKYHIAARIIVENRQVSNWEVFEDDRQIDFIQWADQSGHSGRVVNKVVNPAATRYSSRVSDIPWRRREIDIHRDSYSGAAIFGKAAQVAGDGGRPTTTPLTGYG